MPTATTTMISEPQSIALKASGSTSTLPTLRSLYNRAAKAFVLRDIPLTHSLIQSAFGLLLPPPNSPDSLEEQRKKWDILRITFESTIYLSPPSDPLPDALKAHLVDSASPQALASTTYNRSLTLFTPTTPGQKGVLSAAFLPTQVLTTLIFFTLKINAPDIGRVMIEDWLARREPTYGNDADGQLTAYEKVLELYCLHILPKLEEWDYAKEFLHYETELPLARREDLKASLGSMHKQAMATRQAQRPASLPASAPSSNSSTPRPISPSSSESSLSTTSTHTVVPNGRHKALSALTTPNGVNGSPAAPESSSSSVTATPRGRHSQLASIPSASSRSPPTQYRVPNGLARSKSRTLSSTSSNMSSLGRSRSDLARTTTHGQDAQLSTYALIKASLEPYLSKPRVTTFIILFVLVPILSFLVRIRRRRRLAVAGISGAAAALPSAVSNAALVRKRLGSDDAGLVRRWIGEAVRVVTDTVKMAGSGLV